VGKPTGLTVKEEEEMGFPATSGQHHVNFLGVLLSKPL
jgi:hypothetical protein